MSDDMPESNRRKVLQTLATATIGAGGATGIASARSTISTSTDVSPSDLDDGFDPYQLDQVTEFINSFYELSAEDQDDVKKELTEVQLRAMSAAQAPATLIERTVSAEKTEEGSLNTLTVTDVQTTTQKVNDQIAEEWGWSRPDSTSTIGTVSAPMISPSSICDAKCQCDTNCSDGYTYYSGSETFSHEVSAQTYSGTQAFAYKQIASWNAPFCKDGAASNTKGVCNIDIGIRTETDLAWSYRGEVNRDIQVASDDSEYSSYTKGLFEGPNLGGLGYSANPSIKIRGTEAPAIGEVLSSSNGV